MPDPINKKKALFTILVTVFIDFLGVSLIIPILAPLLLDPGDMLVDISRENRNLIYGSLIACYSLFSFLFAPLIGKLSDRYGRKKTLSWSLFLTLSGYLIFAYGVSSGSLLLLFLGRSMSGMAAGNISVLYSAVADISAPEEKAKNFGLIGAAFGLGFILGPVTGGTLSSSSVVPWFNFSVPFLFAAGLVVINILLVNFLFVETLESPDKEAKVSLATGIQNLKKAFLNPQLRSFFLITFLLGFGFTFFTEFIQPYLIDRYEYGELEIGLLFGYVGIWIVITQAVVVRIAAKKFKPKSILLVAPLLLSLAFLALLLPKTGMGQYVVMPFVALTYGLVGPNLSSMISNSVSGKVQGEVLGMQQSVNALALLVTPFIGGYVLSFGSKIPILLAAGSIFIAWLAFGYRFGIKKADETI